MDKSDKTSNPGYLFLGMITLAACSATGAIFASARNLAIGAYLLAASVILVTAPLGGVVGHVFLKRKNEAVRK